MGLLKKDSESEESVSNQIDHIVSHLLDLKVSLNSNKFGIEPKSNLRFEPVEKLYKNPYNHNRF